MTLKELLPDEDTYQAVCSLYDFVNEFNEVSFELDRVEPYDFPFAGLRDCYERSHKFLQKIDEKITDKGLRK